MSDKYPLTAQRLALLKLVEALGCREAALRRDECVDWRIEGKQGWIYAQSEGVYLYCNPGSAKAWTYAKRALFFCEVTQDGDDEGFLKLIRLPTPAEGAIIRDKLGIRKKRDISDIERERLASMGNRFGKP